MSGKSFRLVYTVDVTLNVGQLWPDGDAPASPSATDVEALIKSCGGWPRVIGDWNLVDQPARGVVTEVRK